jgi:hypothetical protein
VGACLGVFVAWLLAPHKARDGFFEVAAQVVPVILLALVIEARVIGTQVLRAPKRMPLGRRVERVRRGLEGLLVVALLVAEWEALDTISDSGQGPANPWLVWLGLTWGFTTVALIAVFGTKRPRATIDLDTEKHDKGTLVRLALGNEFGDLDVEPVLNVYVEPGHGTIHNCKGNGSVLEEALVFKSDDPTRPPKRDPGIPLGEEWTCMGEDVKLTAGNKVLKSFVIEPYVPEKPFDVLVRLDHAHFPGGRVDLWEKIQPPQ